MIRDPLQRFLGRRIRRAHQDWTTALSAAHAVRGTPIETDGDRYLRITRRRLDRWETLYRWLYFRRDDR